jgi:hypothetical protein
MAPGGVGVCDKTCSSMASGGTLGGIAGGSAFTSSTGSSIFGVLSSAMILAAATEPCKLTMDQASLNRLR